MNRKELMKIADTAVKLLKANPPSVFSDEGFLTKEAHEFLIKRARKSGFSYIHAYDLWNQILEGWRKHGGETTFEEIPSPSNEYDFYTNTTYLFFREGNVQSCLEIGNSFGEFVPSFVKKVQDNLTLTTVIEDELWQVIARNGMENLQSSIVSSLDELEPHVKFDVIWDSSHLYEVKTGEILSLLEQLDDYLADNGNVILQFLNGPKGDFIEEIQRKSHLKISAIIELNNPLQVHSTYMVLFSKYFHAELFVGQMNSELTMKKLVENLQIRLSTNRLETGKIVKKQMYGSFAQVKAMAELDELGDSLRLRKVKFNSVFKASLIKDNEEEQATLFLTKTKSLFQKIGVELNEKNGDITQIDLDKYSVQIGDLHPHSFLFKKGKMEVDLEYDDALRKASITDFEDDRDSLSAFGGVLNLQETLKNQMIKLPVNPKELNIKYFLSLLAKPIGQSMLNVIYATIEDREKISIEALSHLHLYLDPIHLQNKKAIILEKVDDSMKQFQMISEWVEEEKFAEKIKLVLSTMQQQLAVQDLEIDKLNELVKEYLDDPQYFASIEKFDEETANMNSDHPEMKKIGKVMDFLRTGEWIWQQYKDILIYQRPESFDYTFLVANHFKALELYVCKKIARSCKGDFLSYDRIKKEPRKQIASLEYFTTSTLGEYIDFFHRNEKAFKEKVSYQKRKAVIKLFNEWKNNCRNAYQHKDILMAIEEVKDIREKTKELFYVFENVLK